MKTALCLSGFCDKTFSIAEKIKNNIILPNNADVFIHSWDSIENTKERLIECYNPKKIVVENSIEFRNSNIKITEENLLRFFAHVKNKENPCGFLVNNSYSMWYGIKNSILQKEIYRLENDIQYDFVIKLRMDVCPNPIIRMNEYKNGVLYYLGLNQPYNMISDWFGFGDNIIMNIYSNTFYNIEKHYNSLIINKEENNKYWCNELFLKEQIKENNIRHEKILSDDVSWGVKI